MQICVFPVFTFPRIVNKTDVVFMVSIVIVCIALITIAVSRSAQPTLCLVGIIQHEGGFGHHTHSWTLNLETLKQAYAHLNLNFRLYNTHNSEQ